MKGYRGKLLYVDLTEGRLEDRELPEELARNYLGGSAMAARILFDMEAYRADPLGPDNTLVVLTGPLTGTPMPGSGRFIVSARSPLTGGFGSSACGGYFGPRLKSSGYDGIVITGSSPEPVYLLIDKGTPSLKPAGVVWGKPTSEVADLISEEEGIAKVHTISIGPAGEHLVLYAAVMGGTHNAAGRTGLGAVMGAKKLKAVAVNGGSKTELHDREEFMKLRKKMQKLISEDVGSTAYTRFGTDGTMPLGMLVGDVPTKNWRVAYWEEGSDKLNGITMADTILVDKKSCYGCSIACKRVVSIPDGPYKMENAAGPEYETATSMGTLNMIDDLEAVCAANVLCNDMGMDTISAGSSIAFLTECFEAGLITEEQTGGITLRWGDPDTLIQLLAMTAARDGIGDLLADGVKRMSERIGPESEEFAVHSKGLEAPMHDPRAYHGLALAYATSPRGACHIHHYDLIIEMGVQSYPEMGIEGEYHPQSKERKAEMVALSETLGTIVNSASICMFAAWPLSFKTHILKALNLATGMDFTLQQLSRIGERGWYMQRAFNNLCGFTAGDDTISERVLEPYIEGEPTGLNDIVFDTTSFKPPNLPVLKDLSTSIMNRIIPHQKNVFKFMGKVMRGKKLSPKQMNVKQRPDFDHMIREYYTVRELDRDGRPREKKLHELNMEDVSAALHGAS